MTKFLTSFAASVALVFSFATVALALTPVGEVFTPEGVSKNAPYWQNFTAKRGDLHWSYAADFIDQAGLQNVVKGVTLDGVYFPPEAVVMGAIEAANGADKFGTDRKGYPTFKAGVIYRLPVPTAEGYMIPPAPVTQSELLARMEQREERYAELQALSRETFAGLSAQLSSINGRIDGLQTGQETLQTRVEGLATDVNQAKSENARATSVTSNSGLGLIGGLVLLAILLVALLTYYFSGRKTMKVASAVHNLKENVEAQGKRLEATESVATSAQALATETQKDVGVLKEDISVMAKIHPADVKWDESNPSLEKLKPGAAAVQWRLSYNGQPYSFKLWVTNETPAGQVQTDIVRNIQSGQPADAMSVNRLQTRVTAAIADGRLPPNIKAAAVG
jgi:outer membrane murein-binding lipoprotein Lpp